MPYALRRQPLRIIVTERGLQYACNLLPGYQIDSDGAAFALTAVSVDADNEVFVDAAFAFSGLDQHGASKLPVRSQMPEV